jgi:hypothetical protein
MFAVVTLEREPPSAADLLIELVTRIQDAGGYAFFATLLWLIFGYAFMRPEQRRRIPTWQGSVFTIALAGTAAFYLVAFFVYLWEVIRQRSGGPPLKIIWHNVYYSCLTLGGLLALVGAALPFLRNLPALRWRRIWALTRLTFKEAIRRRVLYAFSFLLLVFLFASWFVPYKPEYQVRTYVWVFDTATTYVLLLVAVLTASFSIPTDIRQQTIHTILTKPVERFEVLVGRFLGFTALMSLVLLVMTSFSLLFVLRSVDPAAAAESLKAREPLYGELHFENTPDERKATNVGREWDYRSYLSGPGPGRSPQIAVYDFASVPGGVGDRQQVRCEFGFDIYRTTKGLENKGVPCELIFQTPQFAPGQEEEYSKARRTMLDGGASEAAVDNELAERFGYYAVPSLEVTDYHTQSVDVPGGLFKNAARNKASGQPPLQVRVVCKSTSQYIGVAKGDLYFRMDDPSGRWDRLYFAWNYYKGAFGLWLRLALIIGLAVTMSTYLSGVISLLVTATLFVGGTFIDFIKTVAAGTSLGGGPMESLVRIATKQVAAVPLPETPTTWAALGGDAGFRWVMRRVLDLLPDIDRFDLRAYVQEGFNIPGMQLVFLFLLLVIYLAPWMLLAYYLMKWREVASAN